MARLTRLLATTLHLSSLALVHGTQSGNSEASDPRGQCGRWPASLSAQSPHGASCPVPAVEAGTRQRSGEAPWTYRPYCADTPYCVYTNSEFQGSGVSIITAPEESKRLAVLLESVFRPSASADASAQSNPVDPAYEVRDIPGKGKGVVATRLIPKGEVIMVDHASIMADVQFPARVKQAIGRDLIRKAVSQLRDPEVVLSLGTSSTTGAVPVAEDVLRTNTFAATVNGVSYMALFPKISRINHACKPTAFTRFSEQTLTQKAVAFRDIQPGEEIAISYSEFGLTHKERQETLLRRWGFECTCELCSSGADEIAASDRRRRRIKAIRGEVMELISNGAILKAIDVYDEIIHLVKREQLVEHLGEHHEVLARLHLAANNRGSAERYARLALHDMENFGGPEVYDSVNELRSILKQLRAATSQA